MFIRTKTTPNSPRRSIQICENIRVKDKIKQKIIHYVGIAVDNDEEQKLRDYAAELVKKITVQRTESASQQSIFPLTEKDMTVPLRGRLRQKTLKEVLPPSEVRLDEIVEESRKIEGVHEAGGALFDELYGGLLKSKRKMERLKDLVLLRLIQPCSKHAAQKKLQKHFNKTYDLDTLYRLMDDVFPQIPLIKQRTFEKTVTLFPEKMDFVFFDVTTLYFESIETDELRQYGYSKDHRFNTTQVVLALATNQDGLPVGYELFEGNRAEVTTLLAALESWKTFFKVESVCFIGDRAMFTKKNLKILEQHRCHYIIAAKLRMLPEAFQKNLFDEQFYHPTILKQSLVWVGEFHYEGARLIVSYKTQRALKDQKEREHILKKIEKTLGKKGNPSTCITNAGIKKFLTKDQNACVMLDEEKVLADEAWDGLHGVITNIPEESTESIIARYAGLWVIEESFRVNKHQLEMRPIYHWKPERIHAHIALCYMSFSLLRHLQYRVNLTQKTSINAILEELLNVQSSIYLHRKTKDRYRVPGFFTHTARKIYKALGVHRTLDAEPYL